ncbi:uncharacterized protein METZ01_LOCUS406570, partial [marine metagenome]
MGNDVTDEKSPSFAELSEWIFSSTGDSLSDRIYASRVISSNCY